ncbi:MAG: class I SAM-dependent methyltransferase, partial [Pyrinomonadaceae bacterium]
VAESLLTAYPQFFSVEGAAESTTLPSRSVNVVTAGQAFHWFDSAKARAEFARILKPPGWVVLAWNERRLDSTPFLLDYEQLMMRYGTDYQRVRYENITSEIPGFFAPQLFKLESFDNIQQFDFESLQGRVLSSSYTPERGDPSFNPMMGQLREKFESHQKNGHVAFEYDTRVYYGHLGII